MVTPAIPTATYRLQFNSRFTFADATRLVPYLHDLGISHCYSSPLLKSRPGSTHGYDIVDHSALNPELGSREEFERFAATLREHNMGLIVDLVPNHVGIGGSDNRWWLDVLENGPSSPYAIFFDIEWEPDSRFLRHKVLLPLLDDHYGKVLERGDIILDFLPKGVFAARYHEHLLPIDPKTYPQILVTVLNMLKESLEEKDPLPAMIRELIDKCQGLPGRLQVSRRRRQVRRERIAEYKSRLANLYREPPVRNAIAAALAIFNGAGKGKTGYSALHRLLEKQAYRLAFWRVAADDINYRRFFNINSLAGLRMERAEVFEATHNFTLELIAGNLIQGLRIDHPDGLFDPGEYYRRLSKRLRHLAVTSPAGGQDHPYLVIEKILATHEQLPASWPVHGTTGYDFTNLVNGIFIRPASAAVCSRIYRQFIGSSLDYNEIVYQCKKLIIKVQLSSELTVLANLLKAIAERDIHTRDYTLNGLRETLTEIVACFPVYRTYITPRGATATDHHYIDRAVELAKAHSRASDISIYDFVRDTLFMAGTANKRTRTFREAVHFTMKLQQYTPPVMAKAMEDTVFYVYNRFISLNEVGGDPQRFGIPLADFHRENQERLLRLPHALVATSTHDTKRSDDVRVRLNVLSELPEDWRRHVMHWRKINRRHRRKVDDGRAPSRNDEYLLYQTLLGSWPLEPLAGEELMRYRQRIEDYMLKAVKEAKIHTSWINPFPAYEEATADFVQTLLTAHEDNLFLADFLPFQRRIAYLGLLNSLSQTLLKLTVPGAPDIYQGTETWNFSLVDPDNRRPVDFDRLLAMLAQLQTMPIDAAAVASLLEHIDDGRLKMFVTWRALQFRKQNTALFQAGDYWPLTVEGDKKEHLCAFARQHKGKSAIVLATRFHAGLLTDIASYPITAAVEIWQDTRIFLPASETKKTFVNVFTGEAISPNRGGEHGWLPVSVVLKTLPAALLDEKH